MTKEEKQALDKRKTKWNAFNLIPSTEEGYDIDEEAKYHYKMLCFIAAEKDPLTADKLFTEYSLMSVYEMLMMKRAVEF